MTNKFVLLDFHEHDTAEALKYLIGLVESGQISGIVFAVSIKRGRNIFGATGRLASNLTEAAGMASMLNLHMCRNALEIK